MIYEKVYVKTVCEFLRSGGIRPLEIIWVNGKRYSVDRVKEIERKPCKSGGILPVRYTIFVLGQQKYIYYEPQRERWFVEREIL